MKAIEIAYANNVFVSIDLSDSGLIERIKPVFRNLVENQTDILFVNEDEARTFTGMEPQKAVVELGKMCKLVIVKLGEKGSLICSKNEVTKIPAEKTAVVNTNGAGDMYAAGLLHGISSGLTIEQSGKLGSYASSLVVASSGARYGSVIDYKRILKII